MQMKGSIEVPSSVFQAPSVGARRVEGVVPHIVLQRGRRPWACAACGTEHRVRPDPRCGGVLFCTECSDRSRNLSDWDDIGAGD